MSFGDEEEEKYNDFNSSPKGSENSHSSSFVYFDTSHLIEDEDEFEDA